MKVNKIFSIALSLIMAFSITACSGGDASDDSAASETQTGASNADTNDANANDADASNANDTDADDSQISNEEYYVQVENVITVQKSFEDKLGEMVSQISSSVDIDAYSAEIKEILNGFDEFLAIEKAPEAYAEIHSDAKENIQKYKENSIKIIDSFVKTSKGDTDIDYDELTAASREFTNANKGFRNNWEKIKEIHDAL